jgi:hypothetical protein
MSLLIPGTEVKQLTFNGATPALGQTNIQLRIPRQSRWLLAALVHVNATIGGTVSATANRDYLEGLFTEIRLRVADKAGPNRTSIKAPSASLIAWHNELHSGGSDRFTQQIIRNSGAHTSGSTLDLFVPIHIRDPRVGEPVGYRTALPLYSSSTGTGVAEDPVLEFDLLPNNASMNLGASATLTINRISVTLYFADGPDTIEYIPQELVSHLPTVTSASPNGWDFPRQGLLSGFLIEEFSDVNYGIRANFFPDNTGASLYTLKYGRRSLMEFYVRALQAQRDWYSAAKPANGATEVPGQQPFIGMVDLLTTRPNDDAFSAGSLLSLYGDQQGDLARLEWTSPASANARFRLLQHKFLTTNRAALNLA